MVFWGLPADEAKPFPFGAHFTREIASVRLLHPFFPKPRCLNNPTKSMFRALYQGPPSQVPRPNRGHFNPNGFVVPKPAAAPPMAAGYGRSRVDIGRCEAQGGAPRPPPQPTGPRGPLGPCPAHLAPWRAVQAPTTRPIRPLAALAAVVGGHLIRPLLSPIWPTHAPKAAVAGPYAPRGPLQWLGVAWDVLVWSLCRHFGYCHLNAPCPAWAWS